MVGGESPLRAAQATERGEQPRAVRQVGIVRLVTAEEPPDRGQLCGTRARRVRARGERGRVHLDRYGESLHAYRLATGAGGVALLGSSRPAARVCMKLAVKRSLSLESRKPSRPITTTS